MKAGALGASFSYDTDAIVTVSLLMMYTQRKDSVSPHAQTLLHGGYVVLSGLQHANYESITERIIAMQHCTLTAR